MFYLCFLYINIDPEEILHGVSSRGTGKWSLHVTFPQKETVLLTAEMPRGFVWFLRSLKPLPYPLGYGSAVQFLVGIWELKETAGVQAI